jgi:hypothetical protein
MATVIAKVKTPSRRPHASKPKTVVDGEYLLTADEFDRIDSLLDRRAEFIDGRIMERTRRLSAARAGGQPTKHNTQRVATRPIIIEQILC